MMDELAQSVSQKTGLSMEQSQEVVNVVLSHLKAKLPAPLASGLDNYLAGGSAGGGSLLDEAKGMASGLGGMFGKKTE